MRIANPIEALTAALLCVLAAACANRAPDAPESPSPEVAATPAVESTSEPSGERTGEPTPPAPSTFNWPLPTGWRAETIPFPLGFAPTIPHRGVEELRFAPGMFEAGSEDFWTYAFVWWLEGDVALDADTLNEELALYFEGLSAAVEGPDFDAERAKVVAQLAPAPADDATRTRWRGTVSSYDAFATQARIELQVEVERYRCEAQDRTVAMFSISPQPRGHAVWSELASIVDSFRCSP